MGEAPGDIVADGPCRLLTERREARPVVDVDQHGTVGLGERHVAPEHLQAENRRRLERERLQAVLVHLRSLSGEPRLRAVPPEETSVRDAVELHDRPWHMFRYSSATGSCPCSTSNSLVLTARHPFAVSSPTVASRMAESFTRCCMGEYNGLR